MELMQVNGVRLEVQRLAPAPGAGATHGGPDRPGPPAGGRAPLVFLHEGLGSVSLWRDWPQRLCDATGRAGVVYSRRGYGHSDPVPDVRDSGRLRPDYMHREALEVLPALMAGLGINTPVLVGHSDGATIALLHASRHTVAACVVMAPHVVVEDVSVRSIAQAREAFLAGGLRERLARHHADVDGAFRQWNDIWLDPAFRSFDIRRDCAGITAPLLAIQGEDDEYGTMVQIEEIARAAPRTRLLKLAACGHSPQRDQPEATLAAITAFLAD